MKNFWIVIIAVVLLIIVNTFNVRLTTDVPTVNAQIGTRYFWTDSVAVSTTWRDSLFDNSWQSVTLKFISTTGLIRMSTGVADTTSFFSRTTYTVAAGEAINIGSGTKLKRLRWKGSGTGSLQMVGYKNVKQY